MLTTVGIGGIEVVSLLDGVEDMDDPDILDPLHGPSDEVWDPYRTLYPAVFAAHGGWRPRVHGTILRSHGRTILVDTSVGGPTSPAMSWYPAPGKLLGSLAESGTAPGDVDVVVITHVHDDHIGGTVGTSPATPQVIRSSTSRMAGRRCCCRATRSISPPAPALVGFPPVTDSRRRDPYLEGGVAVVATASAATGGARCR